MKLKEKENKPKECSIKSINDLLCMSLVIPDYQRPYKWTD